METEDFIGNRIVGEEGSRDVMCFNFVINPFLLRNLALCAAV